MRHGFCVLVLLISSVAQAQMPNEVIQPLRLAVPATSTVQVGRGDELHPGVEFLMKAGSGWQAPNQAASGQFGLGALLTVRRDWLRAGLLLDAGGELFGWGQAHVGGVVGAVWDLNAPFRFEVLVEGGLSSYSNVGAGLFSNASGDTTATLPYVGAKVSANWRFAARKAVLGLWAGYQQDLGTATVEPRVTTCLLGCTTTQEAIVVGGGAFFVGTRIGFAP